MRVCARIEFLIIRCLHTDDGGDTENVVRAGATRNIGGRTIQTEQNLAVAIGAADDADKLAGNVAGI